MGDVWGAVRADITIPLNNVHWVDDTRRFSITNSKPNLGCSVALCMQINPLCNRLGFDGRVSFIGEAVGWAVDHQLNLTLQME